MYRISYLYDLKYGLSYLIIPYSKKITGFDVSPKKSLNVIVKNLIMFKYLKVLP